MGLMGKQTQQSTLSEGALGDNETKTPQHWEEVVEN